MAGKLANIDNLLKQIGAEVKDDWQTFLEDHTNTGQLLRSCKFRVEKHVLVMKIKKTALWVDQGTSPHMPPINAGLKMWARNRGLNVWAVAMSIKKKGTKAHPFLNHFDIIWKKHKKDLKKAGYQDIKDRIAPKFRNTRVIKIKL